MKQQTIDALKTWLGGYPDSCHPCDMKRFYNVLTTADKCGDINNLKEVDLRTFVESLQPGWGPDSVEQFVHTWQNYISICAGLLELLHNN